MSQQVGKLYIQFDANGKPYIEGLKDLDRRTQRFAKDQESTFDKAGTRMGTALKGALVAAAGAAVAYVGVKLTQSIVKAAATYEYEMSRIAAVTKATTAQMKAMNDVALQLGKDTQFSAGEAAQGINELAKAGVSVDDILGGGIQGTLALAASGELEVARAAEIASNAMNVFGLSGGDVMGVADALSAAANASSLEVEDLAMSLQYIGPVASQLKIPMETVVGALAELAQVGIKGDMAGTGIRGMLNSLISPSSVARDAMADLGVEIADTAGNIKPLGGILDEFKQGLDGLTEQEKLDKLGRIFDSQQLGVAMQLISEGSGSLEEWTKQVSVSGEAQRVAQTKMDNLEGSIEQLRGSLETLSIKAGTPLIKWLRGVVDEGTEATNTIVDFWDDLQNVSGWQGADFTGKIQLSWNKLSADFKEWFEGMDPLPAKVYPVWSREEKAEIPTGVATGVYKAEIQFIESRDTGEEKLMAMGAKIGRGAADLLMGVLGATGSDSVWAKAGKAIAEGFWQAFWGEVKMSPQERQEWDQDTGGVVTPGNNEAAGKADGKIYGGGFVEALWGVVSEGWKAIFDDSKPQAEEGGASVGEIAGGAAVVPLTTRISAAILNALGVDVTGSSRATGAAAGRSFEAGFMSELSDINVLIQEKFDMRRSAYSAGQSAAQGVGPQGGGGGSGSGSAIFDFANNYLGTPYVLGGESPGGFDCSGLMQYAYAHFGINIPRIAEDQFHGGRKVYQPSVGDLVFFRSSGTNDRPGHVGMYAGDGMFLEAPYTGANVRYNSLSNRRDYLGARSYVGTYHQGGLIESQGGSDEVLIHAQAGERVLTAEQSDLFKTFVSEIGVLADETRKANEDQAAFNDAFLQALTQRLDAIMGYVSREGARLSMQQAEFAPGGFSAGEIGAMVETLTRQIGDLDQAVAEAEAQLNEAKYMELPQEEINALAENLFNLRTEAADARRELEELERVPLEQTLDRWGSAVDDLTTLMGVLSNHSQSTALQLALLPQLLGGLGASYQANVDLMNSATTPDDIMGYGGAAMSNLNSMFSSEQSALQRTLDHTLDSIGESQGLWEDAWQGRYDALQGSVTEQIEALEKQADDQREALRQQLEGLDDAHRDELDALNKFYDDKLRTLEDREREITRAQTRNAAAKSLGGLEDQLRILQGQGYYTEADIARMRELETQIQEQRDSMQQQEDAWAREDESRRLQDERDTAVKSLEQQQEMERIALEDQIQAAEERLDAQIESQRKSLEAQLQAMEDEREAQLEWFEDQRELAREAYQKELDALVEKYAALMQEVMNAQAALLGEAGQYQNAGYTLGLSFAQGILDAIPAIEAAAQAAAAAAAAYLELNSPADRGPLSELDHWWDAFMPTLYEPLIAQDLMAPVLAGAMPGRDGEAGGLFRNEEHIYVHLDGNATNLNVDELADKLEARIHRKLTVEQWSHGS